MSLSRVLVIIPTYNEATNIGQLVDRLVELYPQVDLLVVDDASKDGTAAIVRAAEARHGTRVTLLSRSGKNGRGSAVLDGFKYAIANDYGLVMEMDADFSHKPEEIERFLPLMNRFDIVVGSRYLPGSEIREWGWKRTFFSHFANMYARAVLRIPLSDYTNGFRCYTRKAVEAVDPGKIDAKGYVVLSEVAYQLHKKGFCFGEVPTLFINRRRGVSNLGFHEISEAFLSVLRIRWPRLSRTLSDALIFAFRGILGTAVDLLSLFILVRYLHVHPIPAFAISALIAIGEMFFLRRKRWGAEAGISSPKFLMVYGIVGVVTVLIAIGAWYAAIPYLWSKVIAIAVAAPVSYGVSRKLLPR